MGEILDIIEAEPKKRVPTSFLPDGVVAANLDNPTVERILRGLIAEYSNWMDPDGAGKLAIDHDVMKQFDLESGAIEVYLVNEPDGGQKTVIEWKNHG